MTNETEKEASRIIFREIFGSPFPLRTEHTAAATQTLET